MVYTKNNPILQALLQGTKHDLYICSLANGAGSERHRVTRDLEKIERFLTREDQPGRGCYFCVSTIAGQLRNKFTARECVFLHVDIDLKDHPDESVNSISKLLCSVPFSAHIIVSSGNGVHAYWLLDRAYRIGHARRERLLKQLAMLFGGDMMPTHAAALMRLPGTHNSKHDAWKLVKARTVYTGSYRLDDLEEWLMAVEQPLLVKYEKPVNPFAMYGRLYTAPIDVEQRLLGMEWRGEGEAGVHTTQLSCTAALLNRGVDVDDVVDVVLEATKEAVGGRTRWDWRKEERKIERMCRTWMVKKAEREGRRS